MSEPRYHFITRSPDTDSVSVYEILYMQESFARLGIAHSTIRNNLFTEVLSETLMHLRLLRPIAKPDETIYLIPLMGLQEYRLFPHVYWARIVTYSFDVWPCDYPRWVRFFRRHKPLVAFISAKTSADYLRRAVPETHFVWAPEAIDPKLYDPHKSLLERTIDVLELGRRFDSYHEAVTAGLSAHRKLHLYEQTKGKKVFAGREALVKGLGDAKLLVCFPTSMTDAHAGEVETMTLRYLEACAAGCLPVGRAPAELIELFGYNPVLELDLAHPLEHTLEILKNIGQWRELVRKNHARMLEVGTWDRRSVEMMKEIQARVGGAGGS
jgi:hypothetical protein